MKKTIVVDAFQVGSVTDLGTLGTNLNTDDWIIIDVNNDRHVMGSEEFDLKYQAAPNTYASQGTGWD